MKIGLIDVDGHNFPNLPLMKLSAYHKARGDSVERYTPMFSGHVDKVYMSKVFTFTPDYEYIINADEIQKGGTGYAYPDGGESLPPEIEHIYPDYSLYGITETAYGFTTRGCPRGCDFCIVKDKEGRRSRKVADLEEFWHGQKNITLLDPNLFACREWRDLSEQLINSNALVDFSQGVDVRIMTEEMAEHIKRMRVKTIHFAWDRYEDREKVLPKLELFRRATGWGRNKVSVYVLCNYNTTHAQDVERVNEIKALGFDPYIMVYNKAETKPADEVRRLQRFVNNKYIFYSCEGFENYKA